ncbi:hypothetical protein B0H14DRAFT_1329652 [Mycena olivaceomarginata]|nr:hypothetical protein B0H14DRAFT_1329652 [Mycena olivaceomarginata]
MDPNPLSQEINRSGRLIMICPSSERTSLRRLILIQRTSTHRTHAPAMTLETHYTVSSSRLVTQTPIRLFSVRPGASASLRFGAPSPPTSMPQPVLHASLSRAAWTTTCTYSAIPSSHRWLAYTPLSSFQRPPICARPRAPGLTSIRNRHTLAHDSRRQDGIPLMLSEHAYPGDDRCARSARAALRASPSCLLPPASLL